MKNLFAFLKSDSGEKIDSNQTIHDMFVDAVAEVWRDYPKDKGFELTDKNKKALLNDLKSTPKTLFDINLRSLAAGKPNDAEVFAGVSELAKKVKLAVFGKSANDENTNAVNFGIATKINDAFKNKMLAHSGIDAAIEKMENELLKLGYSGKKM